MRPLLLLSPAKTMRFDSALSPAISSAKPTQPLFENDAELLARELSSLSCASLRQLMGVSAAIAELNEKRYAAFSQQPARPAIGAFEGQAYQGLDAKSLGAQEIEYLQGSLRILCGLYGVLRPLDLMRAYRLEMGTKFACGGAANLYAFWGDRLTRALADDAAAAAAPFVLNIASAEYAKAVDLSALGVPVITASFPGPAVYAKTARGEMARFCAQRQLSDPSELQEFTGTHGQWAFVPSQSDERCYTFARRAAAKEPAEKRPPPAAAAAGRAKRRAR
ncbi:hypothetical protein AB1Y20_013862 [Prymnesium parvum]|uniref:Uncharacterized protein n=1 Tax=Prymnesium parvum TaxID=97485 RepID=A0AB34IGP4_PRYPA